MSDLMEEGKGVMDTLQSTLYSAGAVAENANRALSNFNSRGQPGESGPEGLKNTVLDAQGAVNNVAEDADPLRHNFFLRGFFKWRGFYDVAEMTADQYRQERFCEREEIDASLAAGARTLLEFTGTGRVDRRRTPPSDNAMSQFIPYCRTNR